MERLQILENSNDGFYVAKQDLQLRGPGDLFGIRQSGDLYFRMADIYRDASELQQANEAACALGRDGAALLCKKYEGLSRIMEEYAGDVKTL